MPIDLGFADKQTLTTIPKNTVFLMEKIYLLKNRFGGEKRRPFSVKNKTKKTEEKEVSNSGTYRQLSTLSTLIYSVYS